MELCTRPSVCQQSSTTLRHGQRGVRTGRHTVGSRRMCRDLRHGDFAGGFWALMRFPVADIARLSEGVRHNRCKLQSGKHD